MDMPFDERIYAEMVSLFDDKMLGDVLLVQMDAVWEARFRQDHADFTFQSTSWEALFPEAWYGRFALIVLAPGIEMRKNAMARFGRSAILRRWICWSSVLYRMQESKQRRSTAWFWRRRRMCRGAKIFSRAGTFMIFRLPWSIGSAACAS